MNKYKNLVILLVVFGSIHFIFTGAITPALMRWSMKKGFESNTFLDQMPYLLTYFQYADGIIFLPVSIWIFKDSKKGMFAPWLWAIFILIAHYQGLIVYLLIKLLVEKERVELTTPN